MTTRVVINKLIGYHNYKIKDIWTKNLNTICNHTIHANFSRSTYKYLYFN